MKYALVDGIKKEATPKAQGKCLCCGAEVIAKCGEKRAWHWAHKNNEECNYSKKEPKTQWHLDWQNYFPKEWQEVRCPEDNPIHIADIKTPEGLVVEFQHSYISVKDRLSREQFHKNMIWVVDGTRLKKDFIRFYENFNNFNLEPLGINREKNILLYKVKFMDNLLPECWRELTVPVYFDFRIEKTDDKEKTLRNFIWGFFRINQWVFAVSMPHDCFVEYVKQNKLKEIYKYAWQLIANSIKTPQKQVPKTINQAKVVRRSIDLPPNASARKINRLMTKYPGSRF